MIHISKRTMWKTSKISDLRKKSGSGILVCATIAAKAVSESVKVRMIKTEIPALHYVTNTQKKRNLHNSPQNCFSLSALLVISTWCCQRTHEAESWFWRTHSWWNMRFISSVMLKGTSSSEELGSASISQFSSSDTGFFSFFLHTTAI